MSGASKLEVELEVEVGKVPLASWLDVALLPALLRRWPGLNDRRHSLRDIYSRTITNELASVLVVNTRSESAIARDIVSNLSRSDRYLECCCGVSELQ